MKIIFIGTAEFGANILRELIGNKFKPALVITSLDKPVGRRLIITPPLTKEIAEQYNIPLLQTEKVLTLKSQIINLKPDLIIVAAWGKIIPKEILDIPKHKSLNIHPSLLPKYRGPSPIQSTIINGDKETGVTIILMDSKLDQGPILDQEKLIIENPRYQELEKELAIQAANLLIRTIPKWIKNEIKPKPQDEPKATYTKIFDKKSGLIDWKKSAQEIERQVRAFDPWPSTYCKANNKILKIWRAVVQEQTDIGPKEQPGKVYLATDNQIAVQCGKDYLIIKELQFEGKKRMKVGDFLKGNMDFIGIILK